MKSTWIKKPSPEGAKVLCPRQKGACWDVEEIWDIFESLTEDGIGRRSTVTTPDIGLNIYDQEALVVIHHCQEENRFGKSHYGWKSPAMAFHFSLVRKGMLSSIRLFQIYLDPEATISITVETPIPAFRGPTTANRSPNWLGSRLKLPWKRSAAKFL
ncbi:unnamed protein product [Lota lota]